MSRTILEFFVHYIARPELRQRALHREIDAMVEFGLDHIDAVTIAQLDEATITDRMAAQLQSLPRAELAANLKSLLREMGVHLDWARDIIHGHVPYEDRVPPASVPSAGGAAAYSQGSTHIRKAEVLQHAIGVEIEIRLVGQGFGPDVEIGLTQSNRTINAAIARRTSDVDLFQRLIVKVTLPLPGRWQLWAKNPGDPSADTRTIEIHG